MESPLAILGHSPAFVEVLHVGRPNLGNREDFLRRVNESLDRRWLTNDGPLLQEFETRIADFIGIRHCVAMCNATIALEIAVRALDLRGEVIVPAYTFIATAHALQWQGVVPVFADMDPVTHNLDPRQIERLVTPRTTGIIGVHLWGRPCETDALECIAGQRNLKILYDAAHAFGCTHKGRRIGTFGECEVFSFHATKFVNCFEGGAVVTDNDEIANKIRSMRNFGFQGYDDVACAGTNGKMTEVCAAMGLTSLEAMEAIVAVNRRNYVCYLDGLRSLSGIKIISYDPEEHNNYQYVVLEVDPDQAPLNRDELIAVLHAENVLARRYFWPGCHRMEPYRSFNPNAYLAVPHTERVAARIIVLPTGQAVNEKIVQRVVAIINAAWQQADKVRCFLADKG